MTLLLSVGINIDDARIPDNKGNQPIDVAIQEDGAPAYFSNLPVKTMTEAIKAAGVPASLSNTAGTFVCNHVLYQLDISLTSLIQVIIRFYSCTIYP